MSSEDILGPGKKKKPQKKRKKRMSPALAKIATRSLDVTDDELRTYIPTEMDLQMAEAMISGSMSFQEIAKAIGETPTNVSRALRDPVRSSWLFQQLHRIVAKRIGLVDTALMLQAVGGNVSAMKLYYERFGELIHRSHVVHTNNAFDPKQLSDKDLDTILNNEMKKNGVIDVEAEQTNGDE